MREHLRAQADAERREVVVDGFGGERALDREPGRTVVLVRHQATAEEHQSGIAVESGGELLLRCDHGVDRDAAVDEPAPEAPRSGARGVDDDEHARAHSAPSRVDTSTAGTSAAVAGGAARPARKDS